MDVVIVVAKKRASMSIQGRLFIAAEKYLKVKIKLTSLS